MTTDATTAIAVRGAPDIPGLRFRLFRDDGDYAALANLLREANLTDGLDWIPDAASLKVDYENIAAFDPRRDVLLAEVDERVVAFGRQSHERRDDKTVYFAQGAVHPDFRRRGLGRALLGYNEARIRESAATTDDPNGWEFGAFAVDSEKGAHALLQSEGYGPVRYGFTMRRVGLDGLPATSLPDGLQIRPVEERDRRAIFDADNEAFRDHWGHHESTDEDFRWVFGHPDLDTKLWRVAWDGDEVAGSVFVFVFKSENETLGVRRGWLERVSVRRPWRRRGLATALIVAALDGLRDAGMTEAMLGVDSENPTGALHLYESLGFGVKDRTTVYRKAP